MQLLFKAQNPDIYELMKKNEIIVSHYEVAGCIRKTMGVDKEDVVTKSSCTKQFHSELEVFRVSGCIRFIEPEGNFDTFRRHHYLRATSRVN